MKRVAHHMNQHLLKSKKRESLFAKAKVRAVICCGDCLKPRCIYANFRLSAREVECVKGIKETNIYTCGSSLFPDDSSLEKTAVVREAATCHSPMENQYYTSILPPVCHSARKVL